MANVNDTLVSIKPLVVELQNNLSILSSQIQEIEGTGPGPVGFTQADLDAARAEGEAAGFDKGVASVHIPETPVGEAQPGFSQEQVDKMIAAAIEALPADSTPYSEEDMGKLKAELKEAQDMAAALKANDDEQEAAKVKLSSILASIDALLHPAPAPIEIQPELPVQA